MLDARSADARGHADMPSTAVRSELFIGPWLRDSNSLWARGYLARGLTLEVVKRRTDGVWCPR